MPDGIEDRDADVWEALLAVADAAGKDWPKQARVSAVSLSKESTPSLGIRLLWDLRQVFGSDETMSTEAILLALHKLDESVWADIKGKPLNDRGLASRLKPYGISSRQLRIGDWSGKGYVRSELGDAWTRYLGPPPQRSETTETSETSGSPNCEHCRNPERKDDPLMQATDGHLVAAIHRSCISKWRRDAA